MQWQTIHTFKSKTEKSGNKEALTLEKEKKKEKGKEEEKKSSKQNRTSWDDMDASICLVRTTELFGLLNLTSEIH